MRSPRIPTLCLCTVQSLGPLLIASIHLERARYIAVDDPGGGNGPYTTPQRSPVDFFVIRPRRPCTPWAFHLRVLLTQTAASAWNESPRLNCRACESNLFLEHFPSHQATTTIILDTHNLVNIRNWQALFRQQRNDENPGLVGYDQRPAADNERPTLSPPLLAIVRILCQPCVFPFESSWGYWS